MKIEKLSVIGLMSGSSLDGVDLAFVSFLYSNEEGFTIHEWKIKHAKTVPYSPEILQKIKEATSYNGLQLTEFDRELGREFGQMILRFCQEKKLKPDVIASHGHTLFHYPEKGFTLQIGHPASIVGETGINVIGDFRSTDIACGGQGAPFAPIVDKYLFSNYHICINLGGIVNLTNQITLPQVAYDVCPGNQALNYLAEKMDKSYDDEGNIARSGKLNSELLKKLKAWPYFKKPFPKSLDNNDIKEFFIPILESVDCTVEDKMHTVTRLIVSLIKESLSDIPKKWFPSVLITGGGAHNKFLIEAIKEELSHLNIIIPDKKTIDFKEALLMALMGLLRYNYKVNVLSDITGSNVYQSAGALYMGIKRIKK